MMVTLVTGFFRKPEFTCVNDAGRHAGGMVTRFAEEEITDCYLLVKPGTNAAKQILICGETDKPSGIAYDATRIDQPVSVHRLGATKATRSCVASKDIAAEVPLYTTAGGKVTDVAVAGSWFVGTSMTVADADGDLIEVDPASPVEQP